MEGKGDLTRRGLAGAGLGALVAGALPAHAAEGDKDAGPKVVFEVRKPGREEEGARKAAPDQGPTALGAVDWETRWPLHGNRLVFDDPYYQFHAEASPYPIDFCADDAIHRWHKDLVVTWHRLQGNCPGSGWPRYVIVVKML